MSRRYALCCLAVVLCHVAVTNAAMDRTRGQFGHWFPTVEQWMRPTFEKECREQLKNYRNETLKDEPGVHNFAQNVVDCLLNNTGELNKAGMAVTGILLSLLPIGLAQIGPSMAELSLLSSRRPLLAILLGFGTLSPNPTVELDYLGLMDSIRVKRNPFMGAKFLQPQAPFIVKFAISFVEYLIGVVCCGNCFFQMWRFTYRAFSVAPISVYLHGLPESFTVLGWCFLNFPIHLITFFVFAIGFSRRRPEQYGPSSNGFVSWLKKEFLPCTYAERAWIVPRQGNGVTGWQVLLGAAVRFMASAHIILGTVLIGSVLFVLLADSLPVIFTFVGAAVFTRAVLMFELHGLGCALEKGENEAAVREGRLPEAEPMMDSKQGGVSTSISVHS